MVILMAKKKIKIDQSKKIGPASFMLGIMIALFAALLSPSDFRLFLALIPLGVLVGVFNITPKEVNKYLLASLTFLFSVFAMSVIFGSIPVKVAWLRQFFVTFYAFLVYVLVFVAPGAIVVSLKALFELSKD